MARRTSKVLTNIVFLFSFWLSLEKEKWESGYGRQLPAAVTAHPNMEMVPIPTLNNLQKKYSKDTVLNTPPSLLQSLNSTPSFFQNWIDLDLISGVCCEQINPNPTS